MAACPTCGKDLTYISQYERWYCYAEAKYAPKDFAKPEVAPAGTELVTSDPQSVVTVEAAPSSIGAPAEESHYGHYHCPTCGKELTFIAQYNRYYCYADSKYAPKDIQPISAAMAQPSAPLAAVEPAKVETRPVAAAPEPVPVASPQPTPPAAVEPKEEPVSQPVQEEPRPEAEPQPQPELAPTIPEAAPAVTSPPAEEAPKEEAPSRPEVKRDAVTKAKKAKLVEWSKAYGLDASGSRTVLRDRILEYMDAHRLDETEEEAEEEPEEAPEVIPSAAPEATPSPEPSPAAQPHTAEPEPTPEPQSVSEPLAEPEPASVEEPEPAAEIVTPEETEPPASSSSTVAPSESPPISPAADLPRAAPAAAPALPTVPVVDVAQALPCPTCGKDLTYIAQYDRFYCYAEGKYAPKDYGKAAAVPAPPLEVPKPAPTAAPAPAPVVIVPPVIVQVPRAEARVVNPCPTCGRELRFVKDYDRWWCEAEKKYAPKDYGKKNLCPTCGKELTWIPEYQRWYCYAEFKYAPKTIPAPAAGAAVALERPVPAAPAVRVEPAVLARPETVAVVTGITKPEHRHGRKLCSFSFR